MPFALRQPTALKKIKERKKDSNGIFDYGNRKRAAASAHPSLRGMANCSSEIGANRCGQVSTQRIYHLVGRGLEHEARSSAFVLRCHAWGLARGWTPVKIEKNK